jgi:hypothetical protein
MIDLKKLSIYHKYDGISDSPELYNERSEKWLNKEISLEEFMTIDKIDQNFVCIRNKGYSKKLVEEMELELAELKPRVTEEVYEYLSLGKKPELIEVQKKSWIK